MKKKICVSGNCVTEIIPHFLRTNMKFNQNYEVKPLKPVFMLTEEDLADFKKDVAECDIFLTQPIGGQKYVDMGIDTKTLKETMKSNAKLIQMPVPYFIGYFPEQFYLHDENGNLVGTHDGLPSPYHNKIIFWGYINGKSAQEILELLYASCNMKNIKKLVADSFAELRRREETIDFKISDYIKNNYTKERLFWTINHPTNALIQELSRRVLLLLGIKRHFWNIKPVISEIKQEYLNGYVTPILPSVASELGFSFQNTREENKNRYVLEVVKQSYAYYDAHPYLVELNRKFVDDLMEDGKN